jgi:hypothetical protein
MEICGGQNGHCVERAISTMRLALGYETGLPEGWPVEIKKHPGIIAQLSGMAFPGHEVFAWLGPDYLYGPLQENIHYGGSACPLDEVDWDRMLTAFAYGDLADEHSHMVIGNPITYGENVQVNLILCVQIGGS